MQSYEQLEHSWATFNDLDPAGMVACASGTAALHLACEALQLPPGSKVIVPDFTMIACPRVVTLAGLEPVFVDCGDDLNINPKLLYQLGSTTAQRALMAVHIYGRQCDMEAIGYWCKVTAGGPISKPVWLIEDLAEAHGVKPNRYTDAACWSFYKNKIVAGEEGGAVWFRDPAHAALARQLRSLGFTDAHDFDHVPRGHNYRMSNAHANLILPNFAQVRWQDDDYQNDGESMRVDNNIRRRRKIEAWYDKHCPQEWRMPPRDAPWVYDFRIKGMTRVGQDCVVKSLNANGVAARHAFKPMCTQDEYYTCKMVASDNIGDTMSRLASKEVVYLPIQPSKTTEDNCREAFIIIKDSLSRFLGVPITEIIP